MKDIITNILSDASLRSNATVEGALLQKADIASPWADSPGQ